MGLTAYQKDKIIKAYKRQPRMILLSGINSSPSLQKYKDVVTLSSSDNSADEIYNKISYSLFGILPKDK